ncbi:MAG: AarF/UbiB family protein [Candidatus Nomurabacteria bacterium]|nr:AarF/UbiB family protein [Candidatus Nomurabacteria bacterium]
MENQIKHFKVEKVEKIIDSKNIDDLMDCIKSLEITASPIGEGGNAIVYVAEGTVFEKVCLKKIKEKPQILYNDIDQEHKYQMMAREAGVSTPLSLVSINTSEGDYLIMERVDGHSVGDIVRNQDLLPKNFDAQVFCNSLVDQVSKMHKRGLYHRDLHFNNVMITKDSQAVIIDFGTATEGTGSDYTYEEGVRMYNSQNGRYDFVNGFFKDDKKMVQNIIANVKGFSPQK